MSKVGMNFKWCQNCVYWSGARNMDGFTKMTENIDDKGKCTCTSGFFNCNMSHMATCKSFTPIYR